MVMTRKHDGTGRRTVDLSPLNKFCLRETHSSKAPFHLARSVPASHFKTVTDAWNGFHSVPIREEDRHLTTFCTHGVCIGINVPHKVSSQVEMGMIEGFLTYVPTFKGCSDVGMTAYCMTRRFQTIGGGS